MQRSLRHVDSTHPNVHPPHSTPISFYTSSHAACTPQYGHPCHPLCVAGKADPSAVQSNGACPLQLAIMVGAGPCCDLLRAHGADCDEEHAMVQGFSHALQGNVPDTREGPSCACDVL